MGELLEGKVAQILSDKYIVIAVGALAGAKVGMTFVVLSQGDEVKDPATGAVLGRWELPKGYLRATHVQERITTCEGIPAPGQDSRAGDESTGVLSATMIADSLRPETWGGSGGAAQREPRAGRRRPAHRPDLRRRRRPRMQAGRCRRRLLNGSCREEAQERRKGKGPIRCSHLALLAPLCGNSFARHQLRRSA